MTITSLHIDAWPSAPIREFLEEALKLHISLSSGEPLVYDPTDTTFAMVSFKTSNIIARTQLGLKHVRHYADEEYRYFSTPHQLLTYMQEFASAPPNSR